MQCARLFGVQCCAYADKPATCKLKQQTEQVYTGIIVDKGDCWFCCWVAALSGLVLGCGRPSWCYFVCKVVYIWFWGVLSWKIHAGLPYSVLLWHLPHKEKLPTDVCRIIWPLSKMSRTCSSNSPQQSFLETVCEVSLLAIKQKYK